MGRPNFVWLRRLLLRLALGGRRYEYMVRTVLQDPRTPSARMVDIVVRKDGGERRIEADWVKWIAKLVGPRRKPVKAEWPIFIDTRNESASQSESA